MAGKICVIFQEQHRFLKCENDPTCNELLPESLSKAFRGLLLNYSPILMPSSTLPTSAWLSLAK